MSTHPSREPTSESMYQLQLELAQERIRMLEEQLQSSSRPKSESVPKSSEPVPLPTHSEKSESSESERRSEPKSSEPVPPPMRSEHNESSGSSRPSSPVPVETVPTPAVPVAPPTASIDPVTQALLALLAQGSGPSRAPASARMPPEDRMLFEQLQRDLSQLTKVLKAKGRGSQVMWLGSLTLNETLQSHRDDIRYMVQRMPPAPAPDLPPLTPVVKAAARSAAVTTSVLVLTLCGLLLWTGVLS